MRRTVAYILLIIYTIFPAQAQLNVEAVVDMGRQFLYYEDYVTAISKFNEVLLVRPRKAEVYYYRGYAKFSLEDYASAENDCTEAIRLNPFRAEFHQLRGLCRINRDNFEGAVEDYTRVLSEIPDDQNSTYNRALCFLQLKNYAQADADLDHMLQRWPRVARPYLVKAQSLLEQKDTIASIHWVDTLLTIFPYEREALAFRGRYSLWHENYQQADSFLTEAMLHGGRTADNFISRAQARHGMNHFNDALSDYDEALRLVPEHFVAHYNRGLLLALVGADNRALDDFDFVINLEPNNTLAIYNRAQLRERVGDYTGAESDFTALIEAYPDFMYGYAARARCRRRLGKTALAIKDETVVQRTNLNIVYGSQKRKPVKEVRRRSDHELDRYQELVEVERDSTYHYISEVAGRIQDRDVEHTLLPPFPTEEIQHVLAEAPTNAGANAQLRYNSGCMHAGIGLTDTAIEDFSEAIQLNPRLGQAWYNRALLLIKEGRNSEAATDLSKAGELGIYQAYNLLKQTAKKP